MHHLLLSGLIIVGSFVQGYAQGKPDLVIVGVTTKADSKGSVRKVTVSVKNMCTVATTATSDVLISFKESSLKTAKTILFVSKSIPPLKGAESFVQSFQIDTPNIQVDSHIVAEVDPYHKVTEANEDNNWWKLNPNSKPPLPGQQNSCR